LWDSLSKFLLRVLFDTDAFNSLCEIPVHFMTLMSPAGISFQFSLWDSRKPDGREIIDFITFNSLCEIQGIWTLHPRLERRKLSILFVRFIEQTPIQEEKPEELSILFVRFLGLSPAKLCRLACFQFSLWDSR